MARYTRHFDNRGRLTGKTWDKGDHKEHYDAEGNFIGSSYDKGDYVQHYDEHNRKSGRTWDKGTHTDSVDNSNDFTGSTWDKGNHKDHYDERDKKSGESWEKDTGCFITSACVEAQGLSDDCLELSVIRNFRDTYVRSHPQGEHLLAEYYRIAPIIVQRIDTSPERGKIYGDLFDKLVRRSLALIQEEKKEEAFKNYQVIVEELRGKYLGVSV